jgi:hypothetical protein
MTSPSQITYCAAQARTGDLLRAAAAARPPVQRSPRSTFRPATWLGRCAGPLPRPHAAPCHS